VVCDGAPLNSAARWQARDGNFPICLQDETQTGGRRTRIAHRQGLESQRPNFGRSAGRVAPRRDESKSKRIETPTTFASPFPIAESQRIFCAPNVLYGSRGVRTLDAPRSAVFTGQFRATRTARSMLSGKVNVRNGRDDARQAAALSIKAHGRDSGDRTRGEGGARGNARDAACRERMAIGADRFGTAAHGAAEFESRPPLRTRWVLQFSLRRGRQWAGEHQQ